MDQEAENMNSRDRMASQKSVSYPQLIPPSEKEQQILCPPEHEVVVYRVREHGRHHRSDENNQQHCTEDDCLCDSSLVAETVEKFQRSLWTVAECRSRMCPNTLKNCLSDPSIKTIFTRLELGPGWGDISDENDASMQTLPPPASQNSTRNDGLRVEDTRSDQIKNGLSPTGEPLHQSPPFGHLETTQDSITVVRRENELPNDEGIAAPNVATKSANDSVESDYTYCAMTFKSPKKMTNQESSHPLQLNSSSSGNVDGQEVPGNEEDSKLQDSCAQLLETGTTNDQNTASNEQGSRIPSPIDLKVEDFKIETDEEMATSDEDKEEPQCNAGLAKLAKKRFRTFDGPAPASVKRARAAKQKNGNEMASAQAQSNQNKTTMSNSLSDKDDIQFIKEVPLVPKKTSRESSKRKSLIIVDIGID